MKYINTISPFEITLPLKTLKEDITLRRKHEKGQNLFNDLNLYVAFAF